MNRKTSKEEAKAVAGPETEAEKIDHHRKENQGKDEQHDQQLEQERIYQSQVM